MTSFLKAAIRGEEPDTDNDPAELEEIYLRLFPKIGRDFVHRDDLMHILRTVLSFLDVDPYELDLDTDSMARLRAIEYRSVLESGVSEQIFEDLINLGDV
jgi:hypothetical protein